MHDLPALKPACSLIRCFSIVGAILYSYCIASITIFCVMCGRTVLIIWNDYSMPLCCTCLAVHFLVCHSLISARVLLIK